MKKIVVFYHAECADGFGGAYAAWKKFGGRAQYIPLKYHERKQPHLKDREIYFIDITYPGPILKRLVEMNRSVTVLDHHVSAKPHLRAATKFVYALHRSGAVIAWKFFHPDVPVPKLLQLVEERDLWKFKNKNVQEILASVDLEPRKFAVWDTLARELETAGGVRKHATRGAIVRATEQNIVTKLAGRVEEARFEKYHVGVVNAPTLKSEIGHAVCLMGYPVAIMWSHRDGIVQVSLRSSGKANVAKLAEKYGGGGHQHASGFELPGNAKLPWRYIEK